LWINVSGGNNMIIYNNTQNENIILVSLKEKREDEDTVIAAKNFIDTEECFIPIQKINRSRELQQYVAEKKLIVCENEDELNQKLGKTRQQVEQEKHARAVQEFLNEIESTQNISVLEDVINNKKAPLDIRQTAQKRLVELTGNSESQNNPELDGQVKNPMI